jgi:hypothetical protein
MYELLLKRERYRSGIGHETAETLHDALLVGFCTHARNLLEFFFRMDNTDWNYAIALDYANAGYLPLKKIGNVDRLYSQLCAQINHLTYERTDEASKKVADNECREVVHIIYEEAKRLGKSENLKSEYDAKHLNIEHLAQAAAMRVPAGAIEPSMSMAHGGGDSRLTSATYRDNPK